MEKQTSFSIYDAAAGSGKTFTLVKEYLKQILSSKSEDYFKHLLAITFTNKAVAEMKQRIVETLVNFSEEKSIAQPLPMMLKIADETDKSLVEIQTQSKKIIKNLLHNYAAFSVETIDRFNHRLIRTFARDLKLATNFEVTLETNELLAEAVDLLLSKAGENKEITKVLLDFALEKTDDDKSWDISRDIAEAAKLLYDENESGHVSLLKQKSLEDFLAFKKQLILKKKELSEAIEAIASETLQLIAESGLQFDDFSGSYLPKHFQNLSIGRYDLNFGAKWQETMGEKPLYPGRVSAAIGGIIDELTPNFIENFQQTKALVFQLLLVENMLKNITPLSVINLVNHEIETIKEEKNVLPISEFNSLINKEIKNQPAPFIYERLGEKYRHFFIDEFQDTSKLQWENLIPLIDNALSQQLEPTSGSLLLVGDAKQSIYRWRGGLPEQFMDLYGNYNPFQREKEVFPLDTNFRSCAEIVKFNNEFFTKISSYFANVDHGKLYEEGNKQKLNAKEGGYVKFEFIEKQNKAEKEETYSKLVLETIRDVKNKGFSESDVCILTRKKADGIALGAFLMEQGVPVISSETLLLQSSNLVQILVFSLQVCLYPNNDEAKIQLLDLLYDQLNIAEEKHTFFTKFLNISEARFSENLREYGVDFSFAEMCTVSLYEAFEYCIEKFKIAEVADAYLFGFMDLVYEFEQQPQADKISFLDHWETKRENASIPASKGTNAVQLMTIHKAKGLEFPVVIFPFADMQLYDGKYDKLWFPLENEDFSFKEAQINYKSEIVNYGEIGEQMYNEHRSQLELDTINLLYVTLTRAVEKLFVFAEMPTEPKDGIPSTYNHLFMEFLKQKNMWNGDQMIYEFGKNSENTSKKKEVISQMEPKYLSSNPNTHGLKIVASEEMFLETETVAAITAGNLLHDTMAQIYSGADAERVLAELEMRAIIPKEEFDSLQKTVFQIIQHPDLKKLFDGTDKVYNERSIITKDGLVLRPDRININSENASTIIDYKTGNPKIYHNDQLIDYANALQDMGFIVSEKMLIYSNEDEIVINKV
ncbi:MULTISPECIES: UvrD-helicase domain-containing protein [Aequorivita]|uniref:DNA 3'-5' helicase n=1 Tax=Aequorivita iocasae TaxID=2803865 RepID=A0ABX7DV79_9FLAO|nr:MULTISPECIES: UvrD-helicase domain-containing protein [Aequorivita]QQX77712.1 UvrD-helicase domain-containing protein [Aequorivita iocasae]UCA57212.1 UvrD-helicase domain-containing protein [Aequorivita sp. F7]